MPALPQIHSEALRRLALELQHAPADALLRSVERIELLAADLTETQQYPYDWLAFRVTGYRPEVEHPILTPGGQLLTDLSALCEHLCDAARVRQDDLDPADFEPAADLCVRWGISLATFQRLRRRGLVARRAARASGRPLLVVSRQVAERFVQAHPGALTRAARYERLSPEQRRRVVRAAVRYRRWARQSLNQAAVRIAARRGRSVEGVRQLLLRSPETRAVFPARPTLRERRRLALLRLWRRGAQVSDLSRLAGASAPLTRRAISLARLHLLQNLLRDGSLSGPSAAFDAPSADAALRESAAREGLDEPWPADLASLLSAWTSRRPWAPAAERARTAAYHRLKRAAAQRVATIDHLHPSAPELDDAETMLRWATLLKSLLVQSQGRLILETIEARTGRPLEDLSAGAAPMLLHDCIRACAGAADQHDPGRGGRLSGPAGLAIDRAVVRALKRQPALREGAPGRRAANLLAGATPLSLRARLCPWQAWLDPDPRLVRAVRAGLPDAPTAAWLAARFGLSGAAPRTLAALRDEQGMTAIIAAGREQRAIRDSLAAGAAPGV